MDNCTSSKAENLNNANQSRDFILALLLFSIGARKVEQTHLFAYEKSPSDADLHILP